MAKKKDFFENLKTAKGAMNKSMTGDGRVTSTSHIDKMFGKKKK